MQYYEIKPGVTFSRNNSGWMLAASGTLLRFNYTKGEQVILPLLCLLKNPHSLDEIIREIDPAARLKSIGDLLEFLVEQGIFAKREERSVSAPLAPYEYIVIGFGLLFDTLRRSGIVSNKQKSFVECSTDNLIKQVAMLCEANSIHPIIVVPYYDQALLQNLNRKMILMGNAWSLAFHHNRALAIQAIKPAESACFECLPPLTLCEQNLREVVYYSDTLTSTQDLTIAQGVMQRFIDDLNYIRQEGPFSHLYHFDLGAMSLRQIRRLRKPRCHACGQAAHV